MGKLTNHSPLLRVSEKKSSINYYYIIDGFFLALEKHHQLTNVMKDSDWSVCLLFGANECRKGLRISVIGYSCVLMENHMYDCEREKVQPCRSVQTCRHIPFPWSPFINRPVHMSGKYTCIRTYAPILPQNCMPWQTGHPNVEPWYARPRSFHDSFTNPYKTLPALISLFQITSTWLPIPFEAMVSFTGISNKTLSLFSK